MEKIKLNLELTGDANTPEELLVLLLEELSGGKSTLKSIANSITYAPYNLSGPSGLICRITDLKYEFIKQDKMEKIKGIYTLCGVTQCSVCGENRGSGDVLNGVPCETCGYEPEVPQYIKDAQEEVGKERMEKINKKLGIELKKVALKIANKEKYNTFDLINLLCKASKALGN